MGERLAEQAAAAEHSRVSIVLCPAGNDIECRAEQNGMTVGTVTLAGAPTHEPALAAEYPDTPVVYQLYVNETERGQGIAGMLMDAVEQDAAGRGHRQLLLGVVPDNTVARRMYEKRGYAYARVGDSDTVDSFWDVQRGDMTVQECVQVMPMIKNIGVGSDKAG